MLRYGRARRVVRPRTSMPAASHDCLAAKEFLGGVGREKQMPAGFQRRADDFKPRLREELRLVHEHRVVLRETGRFRHHRRIVETKRDVVPVGKAVVAEVVLIDFEQPPDLRAAGFR